MKKNMRNKTHGFSIVAITIKDITSFRFKTAMQLIKESFHKFERCPESDFIEFLKESENNRMEDYTYYLDVIEIHNEIVGVVSYFYLAVPNVIFIGYLLIKKNFRGRGLSHMLIENTISRCKRKTHQVNEKYPCAIIGEVTGIKLQRSFRDRRIILSRIGFMKIKGIKYVIPSGIPSDLCILPLTTNFNISGDFVKEIVYNICTIVYRRKDNVKQLLRSIDKGRLSLILLCICGN